MACGFSSSNRESRSRTRHRGFNARLREECLNQHVFVSLDDARSKIEKWRVEYNRERPHSSLGNLTPEEFAVQAANPGNSVSRAPLGQLKNCWPPRCNARRPWIQKPTVFRSPSGRVKGEPKNFAIKTELTAGRKMNPKAGDY